MNWKPITDKIVELLGVDSITEYLDEFNVGSSTYPAIFRGKIIPNAYDDLNNTILIYRVSPIGPGEADQIAFSLQCRRPSEYGAEVLGWAVWEALNRVEAEITGGRVSFQANVLESIFENENCWNVPVEITAKNNL